MGLEYLHDFEPWSCLICHPGPSAAGWGLQGPALLTRGLLLDPCSPFVTWASAGPGHLSAWASVCPDSCQPGRPSVWASVCLDVCLSGLLPVWTSVFLGVYLSGRLSGRPSAWTSVCLDFCLSGLLSVWTSICLDVCLPGSLSVFLGICLSSWASVCLGVHLPGRLSAVLLMGLLLTSAHDLLSAAADSGSQTCLQLCVPPRDLLSCVALIPCGLFLSPWCHGPSASAVSVLRHRATTAPEVVGLGDQSRRFRTCSALWVQRPRLHHLPWALVNDQRANRTHRTAGALGAAPSKQGCSVFGASLLCQLLPGAPLHSSSLPFALWSLLPQLPLRLLCTSPLPPGLAPKPLQVLTQP